MVFGSTGHGTFVLENSIYGITRAGIANIAVAVSLSRPRLTTETLTQISVVHNTILLHNRIDMMAEEVLVFALDILLALVVVVLGNVEILD